MIIKTKEDWIALAKITVPKLPDYMAEMSGSVDPGKVEEELSGLVDAENWRLLHACFEQIWSWLPDTPLIRFHPFSDLCDLCSEYWVFQEGSE